MDYDCSFSSIIKIRQTSLINVWQKKNKNFFCQHQYHSNVNWSKNTCSHPTTKRFTVTTFCPSTQELLILCVIPVQITVIEMSFPCIRLIDNWLRVLTDLLGDLAIMSLHRDTIFVFKAHMCSAYLSIHSRRMMVSCLFSDILFVGYFYS